MSGKRILVLEDEPAVRSMIVFHLQRAGYEIVESADCAEAREALANGSVDLALIDWMLPDMSGLEFTRYLKRDDRYAELAIIMLTARATETDKVTGLDSGADDYIIKPFAARELVARIEAVLRRTSGRTDSTIELGGISLDPSSHRVSADGKDIPLGPTEYRLLKFLMSHPERVYSRSQLLDRVWGANVYVEERTVDVHIRRLRKALEAFDLDSLIQTVRGAGYRMSSRRG
ncbi:MAG: phosphate regulon transcriptional regulator PhoB [Pseudomonadota bacterium]